jgi:beta-glucosidase
MSHRVWFDHNGGLLKAASAQISAPAWGQTAVGWSIYPHGLKKLLLHLKDDYGNPPMYITENGTALEDTPDEHGHVTDWGRVNFLRAHFITAHEAIEAGANLQGYYVWSLMDNFEWTQGLKPRFGIVRVNYETGERIPKLSARWYSGVIAHNAVET